jgi:short-subunit dehydrogenase
MEEDGTGMSWLEDREEFSGRYGPWAVIAGASEGIGASYARLVAEMGVNVVLLARKPDPLEALAAEVRERYGVEVRAESVDLTADDVVERVDAISGDAEVGLLIYNAGAENGRGTVLERPIEHNRALVRLNCDTPIRLVHRFGAGMVERGHGGIVLMTSGGWAIGLAHIAVYSACKAFDKILAEGLWMEMGQHGVDVLGVIAGLTNTPAMHRGGFLDERNIASAAEPDDVAREALTALFEHFGPVITPGADRDVARADAVAKSGIALTARYGIELRDPRDINGTTTT